MNFQMHFKNAIKNAFIKVHFKNAIKHAFLKCNFKIHFKLHLNGFNCILQLPLYFCKIVLGQAKKWYICTKYFWARRKNTKFALSTFWTKRKNAIFAKILNPNLHIKIFWI